MKHVLSVATRALVPTIIAPVLALSLAAPSHAAPTIEPVYGPLAPDTLTSDTTVDVASALLDTDATPEDLVASLGFGENVATAAEALLTGMPDARERSDKPGKNDKKDKKDKGGKKGSKGKKGGKKGGGGKHQPTRPPKPQPQTGGLAERAIGVAAAQIGDPYSYGAAGPNAFDCSGLTSFAYRAAGRAIPRTSSAQRAAMRTIPASARQRGDLVFFHGSSGVYHVGIYVGDNAIIHAPSTGSSVQRANIWTSSVSYGRVG